MSEPRRITPVRSDVAELLAASPPRRVPRRLAHAAKRQAVSSGSFFIALIFAVTTAVVALVFTPWDAGRDFLLNRPGAATATGRVTLAAETNLSLNDVKVWQYSFDFTPGEDQPRVHGECFTTGRRWREGDAVIVRYRPQRPEIARIEGSRASKSGWSGALVILFLFIGVGMLVGVWWARRRAVLLLRHGRLAQASIAALEPTGVYLNYQPVYRITLRLSEQAFVPITVKQHHPDIVRFLEERKGANEPVYVLYDPLRPAKVLLPETL